MAKPDNPFITKSYSGVDYFCGREEETKQILENLKSKTHSLLVAPMQYGKTFLIRHIFHTIQKERLPYICFYIDTNTTDSLDSFIFRLAESIIAQTSEHSVLRQRLDQLLRTLNPAFTYDPIYSTTRINIRFINDEQREKTLQGILKILNNNEKKVVLAIDEIQHITSYANYSERVISTSLLNSSNIHYIFSGSDTDLVTDMFFNEHHPLCKSADIINLDLIDVQTYHSFIAYHLGKLNIKIDDTALHHITSWTRCHTYYTQKLCHAIYSLHPEKVTFDTVQEAIPTLYSSSQQEEYIHYRSLLTSQQWDLMRAIAKEGEIEQLSTSFISRHNLSGATTAHRALKSLVESGLVLCTQHEGKKKLYRIHNILLSHWLERL